MLLEFFLVMATMNKKEIPLELTLVVPCYNEAQIIEENLPQLIRFLETIKISYEIIIIDDYSKDATVVLVQNMIQRINKHIIFIQHSQNKGRGYTVREGIFLAKGKFVGFIDIDLEVPEYYILPAIMKLREKADVVVGKRLYKVTLSFSSLLRWVTSKGYNALMRYVLKISFSDTEAGFKFFKKEKILPVVKVTENNHWFWDTEIIALSYYLHLNIYELPVIFNRNLYKTSTVKVFRDTWIYFQELIKFQKRIKNM